MINLLVDLDIGKQHINQKRTARVGDVFPIVVYAEHGGSKEEEVVFDTLIVEVFFNDGEDAIVRVDPTDRPVVGTIAKMFPNTMDAFRPAEVKSGDKMDQASLRDSSQLALFGFASMEPAGPYKGRSGRAGITNAKGFRLKAGGSPLAVAAGKAVAGLRANKPGITRVIANGIAFLRGETVPIKSIPSQLTVEG